MNQAWDKKKSKLCNINGNTLIYFRYDEKIDRDIVEKRIKDQISLKKKTN